MRHKTPKLGDNRKKSRQQTDDFFQDPNMVSNARLHCWSNRSGAIVFWQHYAVSRTPHMQIPMQDETLCEMGRNSETLGKFVRLNRNGEILEVLGHNSIEMVVSYKGRILTMSHDEVSSITPEAHSSDLRLNAE